MNRRELLKVILSAGIGLSTYGAWGRNLGLVNAMANSQSYSDHKALVCIFLYGGNDSYNMLIPTLDSEYQVYASVRQNLAVAQNSLIPLTPTSTLAYELGVPESMSAVANLFSQNKLAFVSNVGTLLQPSSKEDILNGNVELPTQLFSHNDQQDLWQLGVANKSVNSGWAGRMADLMADTNSSGLPINLSLQGTNILQVGNLSQPYTIDTGGVPLFEALNPEHDWNSSRISALDKLLELSSHKIGSEYKKILNRGRENSLFINEVLSAREELTTSFENNSLSQQLSMVAKMIGAREELGMQRQVFFVGVGGWDTHDRQNTEHPNLLTMLSNGMSTFQSALAELGVEDSVTTFTASEFGRTLTSNGDGTDHGWAGHQLVMGGAVTGKDIYGSMPDLALGSANDIGEGRMIPSHASEEYFAPLVRWFGLSESQIAEIFPYLNRFDQNGMTFI